MQVYNDDDEDLQSEFIRGLHNHTKIIIFVVIVAATLITYLLVR